MDRASSRFSWVAPRPAHDLRKQRLRALTRTIDGLLFQLEELNVRGQDRVPSRIRRQAARILELVPGSPEDEAYRVRWRVVPMMDVLFQAQELIFRAQDPDRFDEEEIGA